MGTPSKIFTVEEANRELGVVRQLIEQLRGLQHSIFETNQQLDEAVRHLAQGNGYPLEESRKNIERLTQHQLHLIQAFQSALQQLQDTGCVLKDLTQGLVDFYAMREGTLVFLCWRMGEETIRFWHRPEDGFAGRQPLE